MKLKELRQKANLTQAEMAKIINISQSNYSKYELGTTQISIETLIKLATFFHVSVDYLIGNEQSNKESANKQDFRPAKKETIEKLLACNDRICDRVSAYIDVLNDRELAEDISKFKHNDNF